MRGALVLMLLLLTPLAAAAPEQVHLGLGESDALAAYVVSWVEPDPLAPATVLFHGPAGDVELAGRRVDGPTPGLVYEATLPPLAPGTNASYEIGGRTFDLRIPANGTPLRVAFLGDMGTTREAGAAVDALAAEMPHVVLHVGDVSYAGGDPQTWKAWFDLVEPVAARVPWVPALGNHEGDVQGLSLDEASVPDPAEQAVFKQRFPLPAETFYYSFDLAGVHFVALDTFSGLQLPAEEAAWLEADLAAAEDADWVVAYLHEPPYSSNAAHGSSPRAYDAFAAILEAAGVDLVVTGHDHDYERSFALRGGEVVSRANETVKGNGTVYVVTGGGGAALYPDFLEPQPAWSATREALHHVVVLEATRERLAARVVATDGSGYQDGFSIARPAADAAPRAEETPLPAPLALLAVVAAAFASRRWR